MPQSLARVLVHVVFSTKNRAATISPNLRAPLHAYVAGTLRNLQCPSLQTGGPGDHLHTVIALARTRTIADVVEQTKRASSKWMKEHGVAVFAWQAGYGAFSVSESQSAAVIRYIAEQEEHHRRITFQDELRRLLDLNAVPYDERYLWD